MNLFLYNYQIYIIKFINYQIYIIEINDSYKI